jgi:hypothetical protein
MHCLPQVPLNACQQLPSAAYPDEMTFRFNRRKRSDLFLDTLRHMITANPLTFERLTA